LHAAAPDGAGGSAGITSLDLDEVQVVGKRLYQLQRELVETQDHFYALYNQLNTKHDFDIHCAVEARTGTLIRKRECRLQFIQDASAAQAREFVNGLGSDPPQPSRYVEPPELQWFAREKEYRDNARALLLAHPELQEIAQKWQQLQTQYDKASKSRRKDRRSQTE
jgi:hypothetical protein